jgi:cyclopropane-fatty-acyl-phospholipid synthase
MNTRSARTSVLSRSTDEASPTLGARVDERVLDTMLALLDRVEVGQCSVELPDGSVRVFGRDNAPGQAPAALRINRMRAARRLLTGGEVGFGEAYMDGDWDSPDIARFLAFALRNEAAMGTTRLGGLLAMVMRRIRHFRRRNTREGSRRNIAAHYDLSNAFYRHWLGEDMTYSSALFRDPGETLAAAQRSKYLNLCRLLDLQAGDHVLEIGCGWGGFALIAAREFGCRVTAITLSARQLEWTRRLIEQHRLADRVDVRLEDYRDIEGRFDKIASIEMFEAVGEAYWPVYFRTLRERLKPGGLAALQVITIEEARFPVYRRRTDFIQRYIFPGGMLPTLPIITAHAAGAGLALSGLRPFGASYAETLSRWNQAFQDAWPAIADLGFDMRFKRMWEFYLAYCRAGFEVGSIDVVQFRLARA